MTTMIIVLVSIVMLSMTIMPSSAISPFDDPPGIPICWVKLQDCFAGEIAFHLTGNITFKSCCNKVIKPQIANITCFCSINDFIQTFPPDQSADLASDYDFLANKALHDCKIGSTFDQLCNGVSKSKSTGKSSEEGKTSELAKNGAAKIVSVIYVGLVCLPMTIMPLFAQDVMSPTPAVSGSSDAPECLKNIGKCMAKQINPNDPFAEIDYSKCCSEFRTGVADPKCFCTIEDTYKNYTPPNITAFNGTIVEPRKPPFSEVELEYNKIFQNCSIDTTFAKLCDGVVTNSESEAGRMSTKIISVVGLIPGALFVWMIIMS
uniref:Uncharacterized protein n=1 Tax=Chenopodium quinoa TaxID=63459 RepID=A0A803N3N8_CHEQI